MLKNSILTTPLSQTYKSYIKNCLKMISGGSSSTPVEDSIRNKLNQLEPTYVEVINESYMHNVPKGSETHFKVLVISNRFDNLPLIKRHRLVNDILKEELQHGVHALSIVAKTSSQWAQSNKIVEPSPNCRGGFGK